MAADRHHQCRPLFRDRSPRGCARLRVRISSVRNVLIQSVDAKIKTFNRLHSYLARLEALDSGADDAIMLDLEGYVTEGRGANVFIVRDGQLFTHRRGCSKGSPARPSSNWPSRRAAGERERLTPYDLYNADEVFYCTTAAASCRSWRSTADRSGAAYQARSPTAPRRLLDSSHQRAARDPRLRIRGGQGDIEHRIISSQQPFSGRTSRSTEFMQTLERVIHRIASAN